MLFIPYNKAWHSLDCCRLNGRDIIAYMLLRFTVLFVLLIINETVYVVVYIGVRANIHLGGQTEFCPNGFSGGGGSSRNFPGSIFSEGGGVVLAEIPGSIFCGP